MPKPVLIPLNDGSHAKVDREFQWLQQYNWYVTDEGYARCGKAYMHRFVTKCPPGRVVHHLNGDRLDNRLSNLSRPITHRGHRMLHLIEQRAEKALRSE